ncbi:autotransporter outer membrane beta-barrel domain-containing protein [Franzmannia qiaohouensis]|uniref:Autotransporter outer membrane beta-barrel domain-containing protein n=1 Tax=Franzmannia qiaohouensis TaxID=1329370 RepID=A0ABU1HLY2_9GAMM|nr:autotransporter outer membrane beta-barrel domain-containing protein [Halomonas qiaohouensis]MDR5907804.1 autotransporter outer membrane beta-barrel domain-containing protein [Halomonas qiaohouensis]
MQPSIRTFRRTLLAAACAASALTAHAGVLTEFTLTADNAAIGEVGFEQASLTDFRFSNEGFSAGSVIYRYVSQGFTPDTAGEYTFGQTFAPFDSAMIVYLGSFDPEAPGDNLLAFNDDSTLPPSNDCNRPGNTSTVRCPAVQESLDRGQQYTVVILSYTPNDNDLVDFPLSFFVLGPGGVLLEGDEAEEIIETLFEVPVAGSRNQPSGAYLDRVVSELRLSNPDSPLLNALAAQAGLNDAERARFVQSMSSNVSRSGTRDANVSASRSMLNTLGKRFASTGMGGQMGSNLNLTSTLAGSTAQQQLDGWQAMGGRGVDASILRYGDHESVDGLLGMASQLSHQGASTPGQFSSWAEGYVSKGSGDGYDFRSYGALLGMDRWLSEAWLAGLFMGVGQGRVQGDDAANARTEIDSVSVGAYTAWRRDAVILDATLMAGFGDNEHRREIAGVTAEVVEGSNRSEDVTLALGASYVIDLDNDWELVPNARLMHSWLHQTAYTENGDSALSMEYGSQRQNVWRTSLGVDAGHVMRRTDDTRIHLTGGLAWGMRAQSGGATQASLSADTGGGSFVITPDNRSVHSADVTTGLSWERELQGHSSVAISGQYEGSFSGRETEHGARLAAAYRW